MQIRKLLSLFLLLFVCIGASAQSSGGINWDRYYITGSLALGKKATGQYADTGLWLEIGKDTTTKGFGMPKVILSSYSSAKRGVFVYSIADSNLYQIDGNLKVRYLNIKDTTLIKSLIAQYGGGNTDSNLYVTITRLKDSLANKIPVTATITINGVTHTLSSNPVFTITSDTSSYSDTSQYALNSGNAFKLNNQNPSYYLAWANFTGLPTTLSGYGITDAVPNTRTVNGHPLSSNLNTDDLLPSQTGHSGQVLGTNGTTASWVSSGGTGTVDTVTSGNLPPLFTVSIANPSTAPAFSFSLSNAGAHKFFGNNTGSTTAPDYVSLTVNDIPDLSSLYQPVLGFTPENVANKATSTSSNDNTHYPTTKAVNDAIAAHVSVDTSGYSDTSKYAVTAGNAILFNGHNVSYFQTALGFTPENVANKAIDFTTINNTLYPSIQACSAYVANAIAALSSVYVSLSGSYSNPSWITALSWSKITSTPTTIGGYGITDYNSLWDTRLASKSTTDLPEGSNLYYTDARARAAITLTTTGTSGPATYSGGVLNIPQYTGGGGGGTVDSFGSGDLSPLFTTSVATPTTTPILSYSLSNAAGHKFFGNNTGSTGAPGYVSITSADIPKVDSAKNADTAQYAVDAGQAQNAWLTNITDDNTTNANELITWVQGNSGNMAQKVSSTKLTFNPSTATLTTTTFSGALSGNASTATILQNSRTLWGQSFNGSANVSGDISLGANSITMTGSISSTGSRGTKLWFTDGEFTNAPTVGGTALPTASSTTTFTNKRITRRVNPNTSASSVTPDFDNYDEYTFTALAAALTINAPSGTPADGDGRLFRIKDNGTARALTWNAIFRSGTDVTLPTTTTLGKNIYIGVIWNATDSKWDCVSVQNGY